MVQVLQLGRLQSCVLYCIYMQSWRYSHMPMQELIIRPNGKLGKLGRAFKKGAAAVASKTSGAAKKAGGSLKKAFGKLKPRVSISGCFHGSRVISPEVCNLLSLFLC